MMFSATPFRSLILDTKDGDWGPREAQPGSVPYRVIRGGDFPDVENGEITGVPLCSLNESTVHRRTLRPGDLVIETAGGTRERPTGRVAYITEELLESFDHPVTCASFARFIRFDETKANPKYIFWVLRDMYNKGLMWEYQVQHTGVARFQFTNFADNLSLDLPEREAQDIAVETLDSLQQKLVVNRQINQTLEQIAQAIFKSWFVDFDPVKAKIAAKAEGRDPLRAAMGAISGKTDAELDQLPPESFDQLAATASLFPEEMEESARGPVPMGWRWAEFGDVVEILDSKRIPLSSLERAKRRGPYPYYGAAQLMDYVDDFLFEGVHVLMAEDGSVMNGDGRPVTQYVWGKFWVNNHAHVLQGRGDVASENVFVFLQDTVVTPYVTGAVQMKINQKNMKSIPFLCASDDVHRAFGEQLAPLFALRRNLTDEQETIGAIRDAVLPKLLSGEITVE